MGVHLFTGYRVRSKKLGVPRKRLSKGLQAEIAWPRWWPESRRVVQMNARIVSEPRDRDARRLDVGVPGDEWEKRYPSPVTSCYITLRILGSLPTYHSLLPPAYSPDDRHVGGF